MKLSILDQSPIISGHSAAQAIDETLKLAQRADALADPCPEILLARRGPANPAYRGLRRPRSMAQVAAGALRRAHARHY
jgi:hypothetical protein